MRNAFFQALIELTRADKRIFLVVADLGFQAVEPFVEEFPDNFVNVGIAEQNMTGVAAGMAMSGKIVFTYSIGNFPIMRCMEQLRNDVCYHNINVNAVSVGAGLAYGSMGATHHCTEDLAIMRALPNMTVVAPGDSIEVGMATRAIAQNPGPCYLRIAKTGEPIVHKSDIDFRLGKAIMLQDGSDLTLISTGEMLYNTVKSAEQLAKKSIQARVLSMHTLKPLDIGAVVAAAQDTGTIITVEEHNPTGGLGSAVAEVIAEHDDLRPKFKRLALKQQFCCDVGSQDYLRNINGLSIEGIINSVISVM